MTCCHGQNELNFEKTPKNLQSKQSSNIRSKGEGSIVYQPRITHSDKISEQNKKVPKVPIGA